MFTGLLIGGAIGLLLGIGSAVFGPILFRKGKEALENLGK